MLRNCPQCLSAPLQRSPNCKNRKEIRIFADGLSTCHRYLSFSRFDPLNQMVHIIEDALLISTLVVELDNFLRRRVVVVGQNATVGILARPRVESITDESMESNCSIIEKIPPKGVSFSDSICTFAMSC